MFHRKTYRNTEAQKNHMLVYSKMVREVLECRSVYEESPKIRGMYKNKNDSYSTAGCFYLDCSLRCTSVYEHKWRQS